MKKSFKKVILFVVIYILIAQLINNGTDYAYPSRKFFPKINELKNTNYNTFFLGSSYVTNHINPSLFDSLYQKASTEEIKSYNLGVGGLKNPTIFYLLENFINSEAADSSKYFFLELIEVDVIGNTYLHTQRGSYSKRWKDILFVWKSNFFNSKSIKKHLKSLTYYSISKIEQLLLFGHYGEQSINKDFYIPVSKQKGFNPLDISNIQKKNSQIRRQSLINQPEKIEIKRKENLQYYSNQSDKYDVVLYDRLMELKEELNKKNIKLIFLLSPRRGNMLSLYNKLPKNCKIDLCNPNKYPEFYSFEYLFDQGHLNSKGAHLYTKALVNEFTKLEDRRD